MLQALPLVLFLLWLELALPETRAEWLWPYLLGSALAIPVLAFGRWRGLPGHSIHLGVFAYLLSGSGFLLVGWDAANDLYGELEGRGMLFWCASSYLGRLAVDWRWMQAGVGVRVGMVGLPPGLLGMAWLTSDITWLSVYVPFVILFLLETVRARSVATAVAATQPNRRSTA